jgi:hypothetical protein
MAKIPDELQCAYDGCMRGEISPIHDYGMYCKKCERWVYRDDTYSGRSRHPAWRKWVSPIYPRSYISHHDYERKAVTVPKFEGVVFG